MLIVNVSGLILIIKSNSVNALVEFAISMTFYTTGLWELTSKDTGAWRIISLNALYVLIDSVGLLVTSTKNCLLF